MLVDNNILCTTNAIRAPSPRGQHKVQFVVVRRLVGVVEFGYPVYMRLELIQHLKTEALRSADGERELGDLDAFVGFDVRS